MLSLGLSRIPVLFSQENNNYQNLLNDPNGILALPKGFSYKIISKEKQIMDDGLLVPSNADGMACFKGDGNNVILVRNHEIGHVPKFLGFENLSSAHHEMGNDDQYHQELVHPKWHLQWHEIKRHHRYGP